ncbi:hypothetical protein [Pseudomonas sp. NPDC087817]
MTTSQHPLALKPLYFPALVALNPAEHYSGGIPIRAVEDDLQGIIPAWFNMNIGDKAEVFWGNANSAIWSKTLDLDIELNKDLSFTIPKAHVLDGEAKPVFYRITYKNQTSEDSKPELILLVKLTRPGEYDDIPGDDGHSDLKFSLDHDEVDETLPAKGVTMRIVPYRNLTRYDRILARWGSQQVTHVVTPEQALDPARHPIDVVFSRAVIETAGDGPEVAVAYQVVDRCGNYPDERAPWSAIRKVLVDLGGNRLKEPLVLVKGQPTNSINLDQLGDDDVVVLVNTPEADFKVGDKVFLTWTGTPAQGSQIIVGPLESPVNFVDLPLKFSIPNASVRAIAKGSASVGYIRQRSGAADRPSKNASATVIGDISQLRAPTVDEAPGGNLPPETTWATVNIPWYPGRNSSDQINLIWQAQAPGGSTVYYEDPRPVGDIAENQPVQRNVSNAEIRRFNGLNVKVFYIVTNSETALLSVRESLVFPMQVGVPLPTFDRPEVEGADNDALDPDKVPPTGATLVVPYLGTRDKDRVTWRWRGSASGGSTSGHIDLIPATAGKPVRITVNKQYVTANLNGTVVADYSIQRAGVMLGNSHELTLRIGAALDLDAPKIKEANGSTSLNPLAAKDSLTAIVDYTGMAIGDDIIVTWTGTPPNGSDTSAKKTVTTLGPQSIPLKNAVVAFNLGKAVTVSYTVTRAGAPVPSKELALTVLAIPQEDPALGKPLITQAANNGEGPELDVRALTANATIRINSWPLIALKQYVWLRVEGTNKDESKYDKTFLQPPGSQTNQGWVDQGYYLHQIPLADLQNLKDGSDLTLYFKAGLGGSQDVNEAVSFPVRKYTVKVALAQPIKPSIKEAPGSSSTLNPIAAKNRLTVLVPHYTGMASTDQLSVTWTGAANTPAGGSHTSAAVSVGTVGQKEIAIPNTVVAFNLGKAVKVFYTVTRNGTPTKSVEFALNVQVIPAGHAELTKPTIDGAAGDVLDVTALPAGGSTRIARWPLIAVGQTLWLRYFGTNADDTVYTSAPYVATPLAQGGLPNGPGPITPNLRGLKDGSSLRVEFRVGFDRNTDETKAVSFQLRSYTVKVPLATPIKPSIKEAPGSSTLNPIAAKNRLTVVVPQYAGMASTDQLSVTWTGANGTPAGGSHTSAAVPVSTVGQKEIAIPNTVVAFNLGKAVKVFYTVTRNGTPTKSAEFALNVQVIPAGHAELTKPTIDGAPNDELDAIALANGALTRVAPWPLIAANQKIWLRYVGTNADNSAYKKTTYEGAPLVGSGVIQGPYPATPVADLRGLKNNTTLNIEFKVTFDGSTDESKAVTFPSRVYNVKAVQDVKPVISTVKDSKGEDIPHEGGTVDPKIKLTGTAASLQEVEVFDNRASKGKYTANTAGIWTCDITLTGIGTRTLTAKALYGTGQVSLGRIFTLSNAIKPTITSVKDSKDVEIPDKGTTVDTTVKLTGGGTPRLKVQIFDGTTPKGIAEVGASNGRWELEVPGLNLAAHSFTAKALYAPGEISVARTLTVTTPLIVDTSPLTLNGFNISITDAGLNWPRTGVDPANTTADRKAQGGALPYTYKSSAPLIASVDSNGIIRSEGNGTATITVTDAAHQSREIRVTTSRVIRFIFSRERRVTRAQYKPWTMEVGGRPVKQSEVRRILEILTAKFTPENNNIADKYFTWSDEAPFSNTVYSLSAAYPLFTQRDDFLSGQGMKAIALVGPMFP